MVLGATRILQLLEAAARDLEGDWVLVGGALAAIWFSPSRTTEDIDLISLAGGNDERFALMELAQREGLPIEAVNSAAGYFLRKTPDWRAQLEPLRRGPRATIHRPTPTLFLLLKLARLSETDLDDCAALLASPEAPRVDRARVLSSLAALAPSGDPALEDRRAVLRGSLDR